MKDANKHEKVTKYTLILFYKHYHCGFLSSVLHRRDARKTVDFVRNMHMFLL